MKNFRPWLRRLWVHDKSLDSLKVALAFAGVIWVSLWQDQEHWLIGLILGIIACALAETEDRVAGRFQALLMTLLCFAVTAFSVQALFPYPWLFVAGLTVSSFAFVMLGAAGERYATIAVASLILAVYTMLGADQAASHGTPQPIWFQPVLLLAGALWYGLISLAATALFATRAARRSLARVFTELSRYLALKAALLEPVSGRDENAQRLQLAEQNARLVAALNTARETLIRWVQNNRPSATGARHMRWYFLAQDVHERASSAHYPYQALIAAFARSDILFRAHRLMMLQADSCARLAEAILADEAFNYGAQPMQALDDLASALDFVQTRQEPGWQRLAESLGDLCRNITTLERLLANAHNPDALPVDPDSSLRDQSPQGLQQAWQRIRLDLSPRSSRFRHGLRLALSLAAGYGLLHALDLPQGYWVLLTTVFVCQPTYSGTWRRMGQRVGGTVIGLLAAWLFIGAFPQLLAQLALIVVCGVAFFALRADRYLLATACITVMVLTSFHQLGSGYALFWPRLLDTVLGAGLAGLAVAFILPDWQGRRLPQVMARTLRASDAYLAEIVRQYREGKRDDLRYRIARRDAHNADADLSAAISAMLGEPGRYRLAPDLVFRFLVSSHALLGYISALGAHREQVDTWQHEPLIGDSTRTVQTQLQAFATILEAGRQSPTPAFDKHLETRLQAVPADAVPAERRLIRQLSLIHGLLPELAAMCGEIVRAEQPSS